MLLLMMVLKLCREPILVGSSLLEHVHTRKSKSPQPGSLPQLLLLLLPALLIHQSPNHDFLHAQGYGELAEVPVPDNHSSQPTPRTKEREEKLEKEKGRTPEKDREREKERERLKERDRHIDKVKERDREEERERQRRDGKDRDRDRERERDRQKDRERQKEKDKERERGERERSRGDGSVSRRVGASPVPRRHHEGSSREPSVGSKRPAERPVERGSDMSAAVQKRLRAEQKEEVDLKSEWLPLCDRTSGCQSCFQLVRSCV